MRKDKAYFFSKRGDERILSVYWFIMFIIIAVAVVSGVAIFYGSPSDIREIEAGILSDKIIECFVSQGVLNEGMLEKEIDLEKECKLNFEDKSWNYGESQYYVEIHINERVIKSSNPDWKEYCNSAESNKNIAVCVEKKLIVLNKGEFTKMSVKSGVKKLEQNEK